MGYPVSTPRPPRERWAKDDARKHVERCVFLLERIEQCQQEGTAGTIQWTREDLNAPIGWQQRSGKAVTGAARRSKGRKTQDERELDERLAILWEDFEITSEQVYAIYSQRGDACESVEFDPDNLPEAAVMPLPTPAERKATAPRAKRDKLAWVPILAAMAAKHRQGGVS